MTVIDNVFIMQIAMLGSKGIPTKSGGVERHVEELSLRLVQEGFGVDVFGRKSYGIPKESTYKGIRVFGCLSIPTKNLDAITATFVSVIRILFSHYDIVHFHGIGPTSLSFLVRLFRPDIEVISTFHSRDYEHEKWGLFAKMYFYFGEWVTCHIPHKTIAISHSIADYARRKYGKNIMYIPNGCSVSSVNTQDVLKELSLVSKKYILTVSRLVRHKGIHFLVEAFEKMQRKSPHLSDWKLVIVGDSSHTDEYVNEVKKLSNSNPNIVFAGERKGKELQELFSHAYLFVQPSFSEGLSIALLEAMGYGIASLVSDIPENREAIEYAGKTFRSRDVEHLEEKMKLLLQEKEDVKWLGILSRIRVEHAYDWSVIAKKTASLYNSVFHEKSQRRHSFRFTLL
ncbi:MAG: glycosyltransferase family 4 protein [Candidatus Moraniibacteriota bacterium]|nr:MAG: glycosyltransferase family 4 protein [Candidatus Moranbacteria bacterium]